MLNLYKITAQNKASDTELTAGEKLAVYYHNIFDYPLTLNELVKWTAISAVELDSQEVLFKNGYYYLEGREGLIYKKLLKDRISNKKIKIARHAAKILSYIPTIYMVSLTGSLAMKNSSVDSDIDLLIVTKKNRLWLSRILVYLVLKTFGMSIRKAGSRNEKDKLCLNMWLDESALTWPTKDRNLYTAHELAQIVPLINKHQVYEKLLNKNKWILKHWPNSVKIPKISDISSNSMNRSSIIEFLERITFKLQFIHMKSKISREVVTKHKALFHPQDWGSFVLKYIKN